MTHIFISYSTKNSDYAHRLAETLKARGYNVWIDNKQLRTGEDWWRSIVAALRSCAALIVIMTPESDQSEFVQRELTLADRWRKPLFPLWLSGDAETDNWLIFVRTQIKDVRGGSLPDATFFEMLREAVRTASHGEDVTAVPIMLDAADEEVVADESESPPMEDEVESDADFDVDVAIDAFGDAEETEDWHEAAAWLGKIREHGEWPEWFLREEHESRVQQHLERIDSESRTKPVFQRLLSRRKKDEPIQFYKALNAFQEGHPKYEPANNLLLEYKRYRLLEFLPEPFDWCLIPTGIVHFIDQPTPYSVDNFYCPNIRLLIASFWNLLLHEMVLTIRGGGTSRLPPLLGAKHIPLRAKSFFSDRTCLEQT